MNDEKPEEELIEPTPEALPETTPEETWDDTAEAPLDASADEWQEAIDAIANDRPEPTAQSQENNDSDEQSADGDLLDPPDSPDTMDEVDVEDEEIGVEEIGIIASDDSVSLETESIEAPVIESTETDEIITATRDELKPVIEAILFVADEPLGFKQLCKILGEVSEGDVKLALDELVAEYDERQSGLEFREIAGGWRISTRPQNHEFIRKYLKSRPTARLSLPALETLAVIAYKQPITIPEILEIRGVTSSSAIKTLLEKRLIVTKGRKETVGRPMMYGTSKEFLIQFGLKDLSELPSIEDFQDLAQ